MYNLLESLRSALNSIWAHRLRSFLTALGIIIGVASVVAVVSIVQGLSHSITDQLQGLGSNSLTIQSHTPFEKRQLGQFAKLTHDDFLALRYKVDGVSHVTPFLYMLGTVVSYEGQSTSTRVFGTTARYMDLNQIYPTQGRFIGPSDDKTRRRVAVIGSEVKKDLELPNNPIGRFIRIGGEWFKIVGIMESRGELLGFNQDDYVIVPYGTARTLLGRARWRDIQISLSVNDIAQMETVKTQIRRVLREQHGLKGKAPDDFEIRTPEQLMESVTSITGMITLVFGGVVSISLIVGGVGIMNIMLVSVTERTREIGICKALGARRSDILMQFLIEALTLCLLGGIAGLILGFGAGALVANMLPGFPPAFVPWWAILLSFGFSAAVGIIFGILPAAKAANLDPIDALRYE